MNLGRPKAPLTLSPEQREQLQALVSSRCLPHGLVTWVPSVLMSADGCSNRAIAAQLGLAQATVGKWRRRFLEQGVTGLSDELRPGRPRSQEPCKAVEAGGVRCILTPGKDHQKGNLG